MESETTFTSPPHPSSTPKFAVGFIGNTNTACLLPVDEISNIGLFGSVGFGKTETLKRFVQQCLLHGIGFTIIEKDGGLARDSLALIASKWLKDARENVEKDVIYMAPHLAHTFRYGVKVNPLQIDPLMINAFVDQLKHLHDEKAWGDRLETIIRRAVKSLLYLGEEYMTINVLWRFIADQDYRLSLLPLIPDRELRDYWLKIFDQQYKKDAGGAAINKLDRLLANDLVAAAMASTPEDREKLIDLQKVIKQNRMLIADLSGMDDASAAFLGGVLLMMIYAAAVKLAPERTESTANPYFLIVDEAHFFAPVLREILNRFRKLNIKVVFATQTLDPENLPFAGELNELVPAVGAFRVGRETARRLTDTIRRSPEELATLPKFKFAFYSAARDAYGTFRTRRLLLHPCYDVYKQSRLNGGDGSLNVSALSALKEIMRKSAELHGSPIRETFIDKIRLRRDFNISLTFYQYALLVWLMKNGGSSDRKTAYQKLAAELSVKTPGARGVPMKEIEQAASQLFLRNFVGYGHQTPNDAGTDGTDNQNIFITGLGMSVFFTSVPRGASGGGEWHVDTIMRIVKAYREQYFYCIPDLDGLKKGDGDGFADKPRTDVLVIPWKIETTSSSSRDDDDNDLEVSYAFDYDNIRAFEVESNPSSHPAQVYKNWEKNFKRGYATTFPTKDREAVDVIHRILEARGVARAQYTALTAAELPEPSKYFGLMRSSGGTDVSGGGGGRGGGGGGGGGDDDDDGTTSIKEIKNIVVPQKGYENGATTIMAKQVSQAQAEPAVAARTQLKASCQQGAPDEEAMKELSSLGYTVKFNKDSRGNKVVRVRRYRPKAEDYEYVIRGEGEGEKEKEKEKQQ